MNTLWIPSPYEVGEERYGAGDFRRIKARETVNQKLQTNSSWNTATKCVEGLDTAQLAEYSPSVHNALGLWTQTWLVVVALACNPRIQEVDIGGPGVQGQFGLEEALFHSQNKQNHKFTSMFYQEKYGMMREKNAITKISEFKGLKDVL